MRCLVALSVLFCACSSSLPQPKFERFDFAVTPKASDYPDVPAAVLLDRGTLILTVDPERKVPIARLRRYRRLKILNEDGLRYAKLQIPFNPGEVIIGLIAKTTRPTGEEISTDPDNAKRIKLKQGRSALQMFAQGAVPGAVIDYTYDLYLKDLRFIEPWEFQSELPTKRSEFAVVTPPGFNIDLRYSKEGAFQNKPPERFETAEGVRFFWSASDIPARFPEERSPAPRLLAPRAHVVFSSARFRDGTTAPGFDSWDAVAKWFAERAQKWQELSPQTVAEAKRVAGDTSEEEQALKLMAIAARDVRPDPDAPIPLWRAPLVHPDKVLAAQTANRASRGLLLVALLNAAGLTAYPGLVAYSDNDTLLPDIPTVMGLDAVVAVIPKAKGAIILDPNQLTVSTMVPAPRLQNTRMILLRQETADVMRVPISSPADSRSELNYTLKLDERGGIFGDLEARLTGAEAGELRTLLLKAKPEEYAAIVSEFTRARGARLAVESVSIADLRALRRPLSFKGSLTAPSPLSGEGEELFMQIGALIGAQAKPLREVRRTPVLLGAPREVEVRATLTIPEEWEVGSVLPETTEQWAGERITLSMRKETRRRLGFSRKSTRTALRVAPNQYGTYRRFTEQVRITEDALFSIKRPPERSLEY